MINLRNRSSKLLNNSSHQRINFIHKFRLWLAIPGLIVVIYIFFSSRNYESGLVEHCIDNCKSDRKLEINGIVIDKFLEGDNHRGIETIKIKLNTGDTLDYYGSWHPKLNYLQINDSIH